MRGAAAVVGVPFLRGWKVLTGSLAAKNQPLSKCQAAVFAKICVQFPYALVGFKILGLILEKNKKIAHYKLNL